MTDSNLTAPSQAAAPLRIRVTLRYIEILDSKDVDTHGEFRFRFRAGVPERDDIRESRIPEEQNAHLAISEHPAMNRLSLGTVLFDGYVERGESLLVEAEGEEIDRLTPNDSLTPYRRVFSGPVEAALGEHGPWDEGGDGVNDPEQLGDWRFAYAVEAVGSQSRSQYSSETY